MTPVSRKSIVYWQCNTFL